ncbi:carbohydrate ABC transporter permease [Paenibacillus ginsengarvi]|uniref:Carbohydrate ABC transporter permease n=1 Tax=Paenibacillus ginsengarvi TaxID=400777 RepID=A0A3B0BY79_9BACL|nr:carbohydrate ABC transporter permease [Paenibacillus ginsengarvi]
MVKGGSALNSLRLTIGERLFNILNIALLALLGICTLYPFLYELTISLSPPEEAVQSGWHLFPDHPTLQAYAQILKRSEIHTAYLVTIARTIAGTALALMLTSMVAYPLSRKTFPHRKTLLFLLIFSMMFGGGLIPSYLLKKELGLIDNFLVYIVPGAVSAFNVIIMRNFFQSIPEELVESIKMDGANERIVLTRLIVPLSLPVLAVVGLWTAVEQWNAWFDSLIYTNKPNLQVLQLFLRQVVITETSSFLGDVSREANAQRAMTPESMKAATVMIISMPIVIVYPFIQRFFVKGIMLGSVKG